MEMLVVLPVVAILTCSPVRAANEGTISAIVVEDLVACTDRGLVEKLHVILLGDDKELEFVNAVEASVKSGKCVELQKGQNISIAKSVAPDHAEIHELPYKMLLVSKKGQKQRYWVYDIDAVKRK